MGWRLMNSDYLLASNGAPIGSLGIHLSESRGACKDQQIVEVGEDTTLGLGATCRIGSIAGEMVALAAAVDEAGDAASAGLDNEVWKWHNPTA
jgi:hypothetical protein